MFDVQRRLDEALTTLDNLYAKKKELESRDDFEALQEIAGQISLTKCNIETYDLALGNI
jgi:hypothetical protein